MGHNRVVNKRTKNKIIIANKRKKNCKQAKLELQTSKSRIANKQK